MGKKVWSILIVGLIAAVPVLAQQDNLIGVWEHTTVSQQGNLTSQIHLMSDGDFSLVARGEFTPAFLQGNNPSDSLLAAFFPEGLSISISYAGTGTWKADGDSLYLDIKALDVKLDDLSVEEFIATLVQEVVLNRAKTLQLPADQLPEFEKAFKESLAAQLSAEELKKRFPPQLSEAYSVAGDTLTMTQKGGTIQWQRGSINSAVSLTSWGQVKGGLR